MRRYPGISALALAAALVAGCRADPGPPDAGGGPPEAGPQENTDGSFTTEKTPDGQWLAVTFPGKPEWADVPDLSIPAKGFVWPGDGKRKALAAWVWTIPPEERETRTDQELAVKYGRAAANWHVIHTWQLPSGAWGGGYHSTFQDDCGNPVGTAPDDPFRSQYGGHNGLAPCVSQTIVVADKVYGVRMTGQGFRYDHPDFAAFASSLRPPELKDRPSPAKTPADDLRPLAKIKNPDGWPRRYSVTFALACQAMFDTQLESDATKYVRTGRIARYHYPSFRPAGFYPFPIVPYELAADDARRRLYVAADPMNGNNTGLDTRVVRLDVAPHRDGLTDAGLANPKEVAFEKRVEQLRIAPDGKTLYALRRETKWDRSAEVVRVETDGMTATGALKVVDGTVSLCLSPDGRTLYAASDAGGYPWGSTSDRKCQVQEIDIATLTVRRTFVVRGRASQLVCASDGRLYTPDGGCMVRIDPTGPGKPVVRFYDRGAAEYGFFVSPDVKRIYVSTAMHQPYSIDAREAFEYGRLVIVPERYRSWVEISREFMANREPFSKVGVLSPDGKCLFLYSGHVYWLAGAGPLPDVDPAAKWQP